MRQQRCCSFIICRVRQWAVGGLRYLQGLGRQLHRIFQIASMSGNLPMIQLEKGLSLIRVVSSRSGESSLADNLPGLKYIVPMLLGEGRLAHDLSIFARMQIQPRMPRYSWIVGLIHLMRVFTTCVCDRRVTCVRVFVESSSISSFDPLQIVSNITLAHPHFQFPADMG
jgi:hypothetical protein